jgi:hypothetical protein
VITNYLLSLFGGIVSALVWMGLIRATVRQRADADALAFKAMAVVLAAAIVLAFAFPQFAIGGVRGALIMVGYLAVMTWFWRSRQLRLIATEKSNG